MGKIEKQIHELAEAYADRIDDGLHTARQCAIAAYTHGFKARRQFVWHSCDELPTSSCRAIVLLTGGNHFRHVTFNGESDWKFTCRQANAQKWAYKGDLL